MLLIVASAVLAPSVATHDPLEVDIRHRLVPPAWMEGGARENLLDGSLLADFEARQKLKEATASAARGPEVVKMAKRFIR